jgi:hypothetical protein
MEALRPRGRLPVRAPEMARMEGPRSVPVVGPREESPHLAPEAQLRKVADPAQLQAGLRARVWVATVAAERPVAVRGTEQVVARSPPVEAAGPAPALRRRAGGWAA